jgi:hypothetical protein
MGYKNKIKWNERQVFDTSGLSTSYQTMAAAGWTNAPIALKIVNNSDKDIDVSFDGSTDHDFVAQSSACVWDLRTNAYLDKAAMAEATQVFIKGASAGTGNVYAVAIYQEKA